MNYHTLGVLKAFAKGFIRESIGNNERVFAGFFLECRHGRSHVLSLPVVNFLSWKQGANTLFKHTDLSECITGVVMVKIWGGVTVLMKSWGKPEDKQMGLEQVEEGVGYALTRPGLMTFPMW